MIGRRDLMLRGPRNVVVSVIFEQPCSAPGRQGGIDVLRGLGFALLLADCYNFGLDDDDDVDLADFAALQQAFAQ